MSQNQLVGWAVGALLVVIAAVPLVGPRLIGEKGEAPKTTAAAPAAESADDGDLSRREWQKRLRAAARVDADRVRAADSPDEVGNWLAHGRNYGEDRYSPLKDISLANVKDLGVAWEFETGTVRGLEASPIVSDGIMFVSGNWGQVWALDAKTGKQLWHYDPEVPGEWARFACCDIVNRGVAVWKGAVFVATLDGRLVKLDADTGKPIWDINTIDRARPYTITAAVRIVKDMVLVGNGGAELGVRGYVTAYDSKTGRQLWRFYTIPGEPNRMESPAIEKARETWTTEEGKPPYWELGGGGTVWDSMAYDPELDLLYIGVGNGSPWNRYWRSPGGGDNLYLSSIVALKPDTGEYVWHYQTTPGDTWDFTATQHMILTDLTIDGKLRKVLMQAPKNGFFYVLDRTTGELISAEAYTAINWATGVDKATGRPIENPAVYYENQSSVVIPAQVGGHNWQPMAFNRDTGLVYIPTIDAAAIYVQDERVYKPGLWNTGLDFAKVTQSILDLVASGSPPPPPRGFLRAWDPVAQKERWSVPMAGAWNGGVLTTGGGLVFTGGMDGFLRAFDAEKGDEVWSIDLKTGVLAPPVTFKVNGEQYVAVAAGWGGAWGLVNLKDPNAAAVKYGTNAGRIFAFKIGGYKDVKPMPRLREPMSAEPPAEAATPETIEAGFRLYHQTCVMCHGFFAESTGVIPDLRMSNADVWGQYQDIVIGGALKGNGMASFADRYSPEEVEQIRAYILSEAHKLYDSTKPAAPAGGGN